MGGFSLCFKAVSDHTPWDDELGSLGVSRPIKRHLPPAHYLWKVNSYSILLRNFKLEKLESGIFEAGGYKWRLSFYPNGDKENNGKDHISLYLEIVEAETLPVGWEVNVNFKLFVHDQIEDKYLTFHDNSDEDVKRFYHLKTKWGFAQLLSLETFKDSRNGYFVLNSCTFGAEVFVINYNNQKRESISLLKGTNIDSLEKLPRKLENYSNRRYYEKRKATSFNSIMGILTSSIKKDQLFAYHKLVNYVHCEKTEISRTKRLVPPAHYLLKVQSYSSLSEVEEYESGVFESGGYKWKLLYYPTGDKEKDGENYISLYLEIADTKNFPPGWEVNVNFKFFVHDQIKNKYLTIQGVDNGGANRFHENKTKWGFAQLLSLKAFQDPRKGYLVKDSCVFGAEVFVIKPTEKRESLFLSSWIFYIPIKSPLIWIINEFSLDAFSCVSKKFTTFLEKTWELGLILRGRNVSFWIIHSPSSESNSKKEPMYAEFELRVYDQINGRHHERTFIYNWFVNRKEAIVDLMSLKDLYNPSNGFLAKGRLIVEAELTAMSNSSLF